MAAPSWACPILCRWWHLCWMEHLCWLWIPEWDRHTDDSQPPAPHSCQTSTPEACWWGWGADCRALQGPSAETDSVNYMNHKPEYNAATRNNLERMRLGPISNVRSKVSEGRSRPLCQCRRERFLQVFSHAGERPASLAHGSACEFANSGCAALLV